MHTHEAHRMLLSLQSRIASLLRQDAYFSRVPILTEQVGNIESAVAEALAKLQLVVVIQTAEGEAVKPGSGAPMFSERVAVSIAQPPTLAPNDDPEAKPPNLVDAAECAILALDDKPVDPSVTDNRKLAVLSHRSDRTEDGLAIQEIIVSATVALKRPA